MMCCRVLFDGNIDIQSTSIRLAFVTLNVSLTLSHLNICPLRLLFWFYVDLFNSPHFPLTVTKDLLKLHMFSFLSPSVCFSSHFVFVRTIYLAVYPSIRSFRSVVCLWNDAISCKSLHNWNACSAAHAKSTARVKKRPKPVASRAVSWNEGNALSLKWIDVRHVRHSVRMWRNTSFLLSNFSSHSLQNTALVYRIRVVYLSFACVA